MKSRAGAGFTLMELLVASAIAAVVAGGLVFSLNMGAKSWKRLQRSAGTEAALGLARLSSQFANSVRFRKVPFQGSAGSVSFPGLIRVSSPGEPAAWSLGRKEFYFDGEQRAFCFREQTLKEFLDGEGFQRSECLVPGVKQFKLEYLELEPNGKKLRWIPAWEGGQDQKIPWAIRATLVVEDLTGPESTYVKASVRPVK